MPSVAVDPIAEIVADRERARAAGDPLADACVLATSDGHGAPSVRALVLRDVGAQGLGLLISSTSPKWEPLHGGRYELLILWQTIHRQYRVRGALAPMPEERVEEYWRRKVHASRLLDLYYDRVQPQSTPVASREAFITAIETLRKSYPTPDAVPRPAQLRGIYLMPARVEIWRGSSDRLHDRRLFTRAHDGWSEQVLVP